MLVLGLTLLIPISAQEPASRAPRTTKVPADLQIRDGIVFKKVGDVSLDLILFQPLVNKYEQAPLVVYIHGGGFAGGDKTKVFKRDVIEVIGELNRRGFVCASIEYRLANGRPATLNESVADCKDAVRFFGKHATEYGIDPKRIGVFGSSAGGVLALITALGEDQDYPCDRALDDSPAKVHCVAAYYTGASFVHPELAKGSNFENPRRLLPILGGPLEEHRELAKKLSPVELLRPESPPIFLAHGDSDKVLSSLNSTFLRDAAKAQGVPVECVISKGAGHGFSGDDIQPSIAEINRQTINFFVRYLTSNSPG